MNNSYNLNLDGIMDGHLKTLYRGIITEKSPFDYVMYQMIINEIRPDLIIEIGTNYGGSCLYLGDILNNIGKGMVHTVDIQDETFLSNSEENRGLINRHPRIQRFLGGYQEYNLDYASSFEKIMLIEDGSHNYNDVLSVMNKFKDLISENSYMIVEDGTVNWMGIEKNYDGGPLRAIEEFLPQNPEFQIDRRWCDFYGYNVTFNPNGYLKKINF
jgi:cephalosporin hydroxylase